jgi:hypothetical protein
LAGWIFLNRVDIEYIIALQKILDEMPHLSYWIANLSILIRSAKQNKIERYEKQAQTLK